MDVDVARQREELLLRDHEASVEVLLDRGPDAWMRVRVPSDDRRTAPCVRLLERALAHARACGVRRIDTALDVSAPSTSALLEAVRGRVGREVGSVTLHRSGASVMVTIALPSLVEGADPAAAGWADRTRPGAARRTAGPTVPGLPSPWPSVEDGVRRALRPS